MDGEIIGLADVTSRTTAWAHPPDGVEAAYQIIQVVYRVRVTGGTLRHETGGSTDGAEWFPLATASRLPLVDLARDGLRLASGG
jgi:hypothetical protein